MKPQPNKGLILHSLSALAKSTGRPPSRSEFLAHSGLSEHAILRFFPSWTAALQAAGLQRYTLNLRRDDHELLADWGRVARKQAQAPSRRLYDHFGKFDRRTIERRFGRWSQLPAAFRQFARAKPEWADVLTLLPPSGSTNCHSACQESRREQSEEPAVACCVGSDSAALMPDAPRAATSKTVILSEAKNPGLLAAQPETAPIDAIPPSPVAQAFLPVRFSLPTKNGAPDQPSSPTPRPAKLRHPPLRGRPIFGQPIDFRGLRHEPVNEQGVIFLFALLAKELGYLVESIQSGFPDCEAKRQIAPHRWQRVHLEFEYESRNYRDHGHPPTGCDVIVCWRHNWPDHPANLEILELSSLLPTLAAPHKESTCSREGIAV